MASKEPGLPISAWQPLFLQGQGGVGDEKDGEVHRPELDMACDWIDPHSEGC